MKRLLLAMMLTGISYTADAAVSGNDLYDWGLAMERVNEQGSRSADDTMKAGVFMGYVNSAIDFTQVLGTVCLPSNVISRQGWDIVLNYLKAHPELRNDSAALSAVNALKGAYPCPK